MAGALKKAAGKEGGKWIQGAVKHPGSLTAAAKRNGRTTLEEAEVESHSDNPKIRARGNLAKRFIHKDI